MSRYFIAPDGYEQPCIWNDDGLVLRKADLPGPYEELLWRVVTGVLAPDEATVERVSGSLHVDRNGGTGTPATDCQDCREITRAVLAALADPADTGGAA